ncbi:isocitrate dehydrogenase (NADP) [Marinitoga hydrogenitolerans DSM 16785]|uniref:isocitrate dehydrogenase (NADP(+)) n=1 Tax=Marinitoga hydrogenitolerans (strain DSM 16785 / JCM 12826 / AT1271) TaxID=1122195 RepID=A0A1M4X9I1_MARH1|nr:isocitrate/isopropylmalate family dehydrogenase [Marinitoga hydrogenitolerans]SHE90180.1 isocitrate dehydrogenase (NADP) [Marinitoga hydrogenitolerans DSM 16785]
METITILYIEGDGIGPYIMNASINVWNKAVDYVYSGKKKIIWKEIYAGKKALKKFGSLLPDETLNLLKAYKVGIKGPLETPVGSGHRSLNVTLRQTLDLYACIRPVKYIKGIEAPVKNPEDVDIIIFRENTEDVYAGIEWEENSKESEEIINFLKERFRIKLNKSAIGIKPISEFKTKRLMKKAIKYAIENNRKKITIVHKGNIMKYTEGAFRKWCYEVSDEFKKSLDENQIEINDVIADNMFQQLLINPKNYDILITPNLNGDYLSDAAAAQVGGIGIVPGANIGDNIALFEPTHGTAPGIKNPEMANPTSLILSGVMMLEYIGFSEAANVIRNSLEKAILEGYVTQDISKNPEKALSTKEFTNKIIEYFSKN